ncbi:hypothetical protein B0I33_10954 [Prauserella shujinwangii]|uniref:Uncharacterized protein n=1 Tax=Prauserella shujinwangii TaxID=1453103 RepID=A0A2T0LPY9_9PSEU|nr:hypothetical protein [Prauserella shujinwangii]PRX45391.1 hypothetical protein B0I33_10954 [Prauserella shujinwangii]
MTTTIESVRTGPRRTLGALRATVALSTVGVLAQPVLAGGYLSGEFDFLGYHAANASAIMALLLAQVIVAVCYAVAGRGSALPLVLSGVLFAAATVQTGMGYSRQLAVHIPLGVLLVLLALGLCGWVFRGAARLSRTDLKARREDT